jgi:hypothetical protein
MKGGVTAFGIKFGRGFYLPANPFSQVIPADTLLESLIDFRIHAFHG